MNANGSVISRPANFLSGQLKVNGVAISNAATVNEVWISNDTGRTADGDGTLGNPYDGSTQEKFDALIAALPVSKHIHLGAGTFYTLGIVPKENWIIEGAGKYITTLAFPAGYCREGEIPHETPGKRPRPTLYRVIGGDRGVNYFSVRNLTIDCNRANQPVYKNRIAGVKLYALRTAADNADVINVRALGIWISAGTTRHPEGFPMNIEHGGRVSTSDRIVFDGCDVIDPEGYASAITVVDQHGGTFTGAIRRCYVQNHLMGSCFSPSRGSIDFEVSNNYAYNCTTGSTIDSGNHANLRYYENQFIKMHGKGVNMFGGKGTYTNIAIHDNYFDLDPDAYIAIGHSGLGRVRGIKIYNNTIIQRSVDKPAIFFNPGTTGYVRDNIISEIIATNLSATSLVVSGNVTPDNTALSLGRPTALKLDSGLGTVGPNMKMEAPIR